MLQHGASEDNSGNAHINSIQICHSYRYMSRWTGLFYAGRHDLLDTFGRGTPDPCFVHCILEIPMIHYAIYRILFGWNPVFRVHIRWSQHPQCHFTASFWVEKVQSVTLQEEACGFFWIPEYGSQYKLDNFATPSQSGFKRHICMYICLCIYVYMYIGWLLSQRTKTKAKMT